MKQVGKLTVFGWILLLATTGFGETAAPLSKGESVYVPAYSHIYVGDSEHPFYLTVTLSIRNTDPKYPISLLSVEYYDSTGLLLRKYVDGPVQLKAMQSNKYLVNRSDRAGGPGASFVVKWSAAQEVNAPIMEAVMIGTESQQGISFTSRGQVIEEH